MPASAIRSLLADATLAARLRLWIVIVGVLVIVLFVSSSAYDSWRSYRQVITATNRELGNLAKVLAEQAGDTLQTTDLLLRDTVGWYESGRPKAGPGAEGKLAAAQVTDQEFWQALQRVNGARRRPPTAKRAKVAARVDEDDDDE